MFSAFSLPFSLPSFGSKSKTPSAQVDQSETPNAVPVYDTEAESDKRSRRLNSLIKLNHANHSVIYNNLRFHNHTPHILGSSFIFGATPEHMTKIYEVESENIDPWRDSPGEISKDDWRDYLGKREYQRAYLDFFEDQLVAFGYDWKKLLEHYLHTGDKPLINSLVSGLGHPIIHLGYAYELNNRNVAIEALTLGACFHDHLHKYVDDPSYIRPSPYAKTTSVLTIFQRVRDDSRLDGVLDHLGAENMETILAEREDVFLEHLNSWHVTPKNAGTVLFEAQLAAVALVIGTPEHPPVPPSRNARYPVPERPKTASGRDGKYYDFFLLHGLTTSHALRIMMHLLPDGKTRVNVTRSWLVFALLAYIGQLRPRVDLDHIAKYPLTREGEAEDGDWTDGQGGENGSKAGAEASWSHVVDAALNGPHATDAHFVKGLRACMVAEQTWGPDPDPEVGAVEAEKKKLQAYWRRAAVRMAEEFVGWGGFDAKTAGFRDEFY